MTRRLLASSRAVDALPWASPRSTRLVRDVPGGCCSSGVGSVSGSRAGGARALFAYVYFAPPARTPDPKHEGQKMDEPQA